MNIEPRWRKSSRSNDNGACVELSNRMNAVRDSKNPDGPALTCPPASLAALLTAVKSDRLDG